MSGIKIFSLSKIYEKSSVWFQPMSDSDFFAGQIDGVLVPDNLQEGECFLGYPIVCRNKHETPLKEILNGKVVFTGKKMSASLKEFFKIGKNFRNKIFLDKLTYEMD
jgi:hypothetical protein